MNSYEWAWVVILAVIAGFVVRRRWKRWRARRRRELDMITEDVTAALEAKAAARERAAENLPPAPRVEKRPK